MKHVHGLIRAALFVLLVQVAACGPVPTSEPAPTPEPAPAPAPEQGQPPGDSSPSTTISYLSLVAAPPDTEPGPERPKEQNTVREVLTPETTMRSENSAYHIYVVTALETGVARIQSDVLKAGPNAYPYGNAYPLNFGSIEEDLSLIFWGSTDYAQDALTTGTAITGQRVEKGRQYILMYYAFPSFMPLTYRLTLSPMLRVEGRIQLTWQPVTVPTNSTGLITLENPRLDALNGFVSAINEWM